MCRSLIAGVWLMALAGAAGAAPALVWHGERRLEFNDGWRFHKGEAPGAEQAGFDDSQWRTVRLPHDWAIEGPFDAHLDPHTGALPVFGTGWYRKSFTLPENAKGRYFRIEFDGAMANSTVWINGQELGGRPYGYIGFSFDLTPYLVFGGQTNVVAVRLTPEDNASRWYPGAGIYRNVWLDVTGPVHVGQWGTYVTTPRVTDGEAAVAVKTEIQNQSAAEAKVTLRTSIVDPAGKAAGRTEAMATIAAGATATVPQNVTVAHPQRWDVEHPARYTLVSEIVVNGRVADRYTTPFGIRTIGFDKEKGFLLNGRVMKLQGVCLHHDLGALGAAVNRRATERQLEIMKAGGVNAIRTSHNPPSPELLEYCDRLGLVVMDEAFDMWRIPKKPNGYSKYFDQWSERDVRDMVRRDRNHPSVFMWSMGNEEGAAATEKGLPILTAMKAVSTEHDGSRPVSIAPLGGNNMGKFGFAACDVQGYNYADPAADTFHAANPTVPVMGTEQVSAVATRGIYVMDPQHGFVGSYDPYTTTGRASCEGWWSFCNARPWLAGGFIWTGFDYRGEPSPYGWPNISSQYGIIDTCGFPKDSFFYFKSWWTGEPVLHLFPHWNWPGYEGKEIAVWVYSNLDTVELFLNGQSLGRKDMKKDSHLAWNVKYAPGVIEARGHKDGYPVMTARRETTGPSAKLVLTADRAEISADGEDVAMFAAEVQDTQGHRVPIADNQVTFRVYGEGRVIGAGNGDPASHESDKGSSRKAFGGLCMALVKSTKTAGNIAVEASSPGLALASATIVSNAVKLRPQVAVWEREVPAGIGITGLWRPATAAEGPGGFGASQVFTFRQNGGLLTGTIESSGRGGETTVAIEEGRVGGANISFKAGNAAYTGELKGDVIELQRTGGEPDRRERPAPSEPSGPRPAIGPPPDGSDPSHPAFVGLGGGRGPQTPAPIVLHRTKW